MNKLSIAIILWISLISTSLVAMPDSYPHDQEDFIAKLHPEHPRLWLNKVKLKTIQEQQDQVSLKLKSLLKRDAERELTTSLDLDDLQTIDLMLARKIQKHFLCLALAYQIFDDSRYADKVIAELTTLTSIHDWGIGHFLDVSEVVLAVGISYDWLFHLFTPQQKKQIVEAIVHKALIPSLRYPMDEGSWVNGSFNWNPVCHGSLLTAALAIAEDESSLSEIVVKRAIKYLPIAGASYSPHGAFCEGPSYWAYGTTFYIFAIESLRSSLNQSFGLEEIPGFLNTAQYRIQMTGPTGMDYNYSDYHLEHLNEPILFWFANETQNRNLSDSETKKIEHLLEQNSQAKDARSKIQASRHTPLALLWWNPELTTHKHKKQPNINHWIADGEAPICVMRSNWNDPNATYVAMKGGSPHQSHGHMDAGSFILEKNCIRWAVDLGSENYNKMRAADTDMWNYHQDSSRWDTFRVGPEAHNILRFNGQPQITTGKAIMISNSHNTVNPSCVMDLSSLYSDLTQEVMRTLKLHIDGQVSIEDHWQAKDQKLEVTFQWLTHANVEPTERGFSLNQNGQRMIVTVQPLSTEVIVQDLSSPSGVQNSPNPNLKRILIQQQTDAHQSGYLKVMTHVKF